MTITINTENRNKKRKINLSKIKKIAHIILREFERDNVELNIVFLSDRRIQALNMRYLDTDAPTDVIAFPAKGIRDKGPKVKRLFGDIAISSDKAARNAKIYGMSFSEEITLYVIHGILHLVGYKDSTDRSRAIIRKKENELLQKVKKFS